MNYKAELPLIFRISVPHGITIQVLINYVNWE